MRRLIGAFSLAGLLVGVLVGPASAVAPAPTVWATINGGGTAEMQALGTGPGPSFWGAGVTLYSDGTASGHFDCVDQQGDPFPGNIWGNVTSWFIDGDGFVSLNVVGEDFNFPGGHPQDVAFTVRIQQFGGAGVGHWTLEDTASGFITCYELLTSGQIVIRYA